MAEAVAPGMSQMSVRIGAIKNMQVTPAEAAIDSAIVPDPALGLWRGEGTRSKSEIGMLNVTDQTGHAPETQSAWTKIGGRLPTDIVTIANKDEEADRGHAAPSETAEIDRTKDLVLVRHIAPDQRVVIVAEKVVLDHLSATRKLIEVLRNQGHTLHPNRQWRPMEIRSDVKIVLEVGTESACHLLPPSFAPNLNHPQKRKRHRTLGQCTQ